MRRGIFFVLALAVVLSSCTAEAREEWRIGAPPLCETTSRGRLLLMAQSVPETSLIPCVGDLTLGWEYQHASTRTGESVLEFTNDTHDLDADVVLTPSCDLSDAQPAESPRPGTQLHVSGDGATMLFTFDGGCISFEYENRELAESEDGRDLIAGVPFMTRDELRELSGWTL